MSEPVIQATDLVKNFPVASKKLGEKPKTLHAVGGVTLTVNKGEIFGVVGESGCGKSTLGRCLLRLETITGGQVLFQGRERCVSRARTSPASPARPSSPCAATCR